MNDNLKSLTTLVMLRAMVSMAIADQSIDDREVDKIREIYNEETGHSIDAEDVVSIARIMRFDRLDTLKAVRDSASLLDDATRGDIVRAAHRVLVSDGEVTPEEYTRLRDIASALGLSDASYAELVRELSS